MAARKAVVILPFAQAEMPAGDTLDPVCLPYASGSNANGKWRTSPDGALEQSGEVALSNGTATILFPVKFPAICDHVSVTAVVTGTSAPQNASVYLTAEPGQSSVGVGGSLATVGLGAAISGASFKVRWKAWGS